MARHLKRARRTREEVDAIRPVPVLRERIDGEVRSRMDLAALEASRELEREDRRRLDELLDRLE